MPSYPLTVFHFQVSWGTDNIGFSDASGLILEVQPIEYRDGLMGATTLPLKRPGLRKASNITLKRGMVEGNNDLFSWLTNAGQPNVERRTLTITLLNDENEPVFVWTIAEAWPVKVEGPTLKASGNEIAVETVELAHEGINLVPKP